MDSTNKEARPRTRVSAQLGQLLGKYYLEGYTEMWITRLGRVIDPFRKHSAITRQTKEEVLFARGFVRADILAYSAQQFFVHLSGPSEAVAKLQREFPMHLLDPVASSYRVAKARFRSKERGEFGSSRSAVRPPSEQLRRVLDR
jgi:hypothetical protein